MTKADWRFKARWELVRSDRSLSLSLFFHCYFCKDDFMDMAEKHHNLVATRTCYIHKVRIWTFHWPFLFFSFSKDGCSKSLAKGMLILSQAQPIQTSQATPLVSSMQSGTCKFIRFSRKCAIKWFLVFTCLLHHILAVWRWAILPFFALVFSSIKWV